ncbi:amino acid/amide ABC transporter ATP-binding protein 1 (HAAT family) [Antricoccus suffuscus]|uniref:Amino acid/amide ABC transporter ATP-binding protein 1 (HAAT family) n=1 Tax=Antricoccus suffuscus TaxID=1629062 RepID=A0A2T0ZWY1_9ACTN|nr:ATP-binding cassette domain-containing protein [Antricoccus suffuscus]PRZ40862.1 amino acid/amide ABC transporter ATP-binding protein 1 (HAAT family) [Antricoccus suffuscus]
MTETIDKTVVLAAEKITARFGGIVALKDVDLAVRRGSVLGLIGPNGAGKTTLVNVLSGLIQPTSGRIRFDGVHRSWTLGKAARSGVARTFQASTVFREFSVVENVSIGGLNSKRPVDPHQILDRVDLGGRAHEVAGSLSFGELRRLGVAIALSTAPKVILLDEPGAGLTGHDLTMLANLIRGIRDDGTGVVLVDHNMRFLMNTVDSVVVLEGGMVIAEGSPEEIQRDQRVLAAYLGSHE